MELLVFAIINAFMIIEMLLLLKLMNWISIMKLRMMIEAVNMAK